MANEEQVALLKQGSQVWNQWREENPNFSVQLQYVNLRGVDLRGVDLRGVDLSGADLSEAFLSVAFLEGAVLTSAFFCDTSLYGAFLSGADLSGAFLPGADLRGVDFRGANLRQANLRRTYLSGADLNSAQVLGTDFTQATLTGACIADWQVGSSTILEGVKCDYIFRTYDAEKRQFSGRLPVHPNNTFAPGEFTQRFQIIASALETIDITFTEGIDWQAFFQSFQALRDSHSDEEISIQGMERKGDAFVVRLEVDSEVDKGAIETEVKQLYAHQLTALEAQYEQRLQLQGARLEDAQRTIEIERQRNTELIGVIGIVAQNQGSKYDMRGAQFAGGFAETVQGPQYGGVINNYGQDADDIVSLLTALRTWSQALPEAQQDDVLMELDALEADLNKPEKP